MKILHINSYYSGSSFYKNLYDKQFELGLNIDVFVPVTFSYDSSSLNLGKYTYVSANHSSYDRYLFHLKQKKIHRDLLLKYNVHDYSLIHAHSLFSNGYIALKIKKQFRTPYIVAVRNTDLNYFFKYMIHLRGTGIQILKEASKIIFLSETYKTLLIENYVPKQLKEDILEKSVVIPNGIDDFWFKNLYTSDKKVPNDEVKLLYVGAINKNKNILTTVKAINYLEKKGINAKLTVVGKIVDRKVFQKISQSHNVSFKTARPKEELIEIYRSNDIFVMPSITESFGLVYAEAMSQGLPVIYTKGQGFDKQFREGEVGYSVNAFDAEDVASKILNIMNNYISISSHCITNVRKFNWIEISYRYTEIYKSITKHT